MLNAKIRDYQVINGDHVLVTASVNHQVDAQINPADVLISLHNATGGRLSAVAGSFVTLGEEPVRTIVQGVMSMSRAVIPFSDNLEQQGFRSLSSNMFLDQNEQIWSVQEGENGGKVCVRSNAIDNPEELQGLLAKCTTTISAGADPSYFTAVASGQVATPNGGDFLTFVDSGQTKFGVVVASVYENEQADSYTGDVIVLASDGDQEVKISDAQIVANVGAVNYEDLPEELAATAAGNVGKSQIGQMVDYYKKVFSYRPDFFKQLEQRIRQHSYA